MVHTWILAAPLRMHTRNLFRFLTVSFPRGSAVLLRQLLRSTIEVR
jgi:hypothetical protein